MDRLPKGEGNIPKSLHINENSLPAIMDILTYWSTPLPKSTKVFLQNLHSTEERDKFEDSMVSMGDLSQTPKGQVKSVSLANRRNGKDILGCSGRTKCIQSYDGTRPPESVPPATSFTSQIGEVVYIRLGWFVFTRQERG